MGQFGSAPILTGPYSRCHPIGVDVLPPGDRNGEFLLTAAQPADIIGNPCIVVDLPTWQEPRAQHRVRHLLVGEHLCALSIPFVLQTWAVMHQRFQVHQDGCSPLAMMFSP